MVINVIILVILQTEYKIMRIFKNLILLIVSPKVGWDEVCKSNISTNRLLHGMFLPLLLVLVVATFVPMFYDTTKEFSMLLIEAILNFGAFFFAYFVTVYILDILYPELVTTEAGENRMCDFVMYNLMFLMLLKITMYVLPIEFVPLYFLMLYLPFIVYRGETYLGVKPAKAVAFMLISSAMMLAIPFLIPPLFSLLIK